MEHVAFSVQAKGPGRTETLMGRSFRVVPATLVRSKVLHNNLGRTALHAEDITPEWASTANGAPVVIDHPASRGAPISARDPGVLNTSGAGFLFRVMAENGELKGDVFLDESRAKEVWGLTTILEKLDAGEKVELSTGFPVSVENTSGVLNGEEYDRVIRPNGFDHLAIFADKVGACSVKDGCGLAANHEGGCDVENQGTFEDSVTISDAVDAGVEIVVKARDDLRAIRWLNDTINSLKERVQAALGVTESVADETSTDGGDSADTEPAQNAGDHQEGDAMTKEQMIAQLVEAGRDREALNKLSDCDLKAVHGTLSGAQNAQTGDGWEVAKQYRQELAELQAKTANAVQAEQKERTKLLDDLLYVSNTLPYTEPEIKGMDIVELRKVHRLRFPDRPDYSGRGGPRAINTGPDFNFIRPILDGAAGESVLDKVSN